VGHDRSTICDFSLVKIGRETRFVPMPGLLSAVYFNYYARAICDFVLESNEFSSQRVSRFLDFSRFISLQHQPNNGVIMVEFPRIINYFTNTIENWVPIKACIKTFNYAFLSPGEAPCSSI
jgi:hypothetical protein